MEHLTSDHLSNVVCCHLLYKENLSYIPCMSAHARPIKSILTVTVSLIRSVARKLMWSEPDCCVSITDITDIYRHQHVYCLIWKLSFYCNVIRRKSLFLRKVPAKFAVVHWRHFKRQSLLTCKISCLSFLKIYLSMSWRFRDGCKNAHHCKYSV